MKTREDWICEQLDNPKVSPELKARYEAELDEIAITISVRKTRLEEAKNKERARLTEIRRRLLENDQDLVATLGQEEFGCDYELTQEGDTFVVYSKVAKDNQEHRRLHGSLDSAQKDLRYLFYNRLYDKYVRAGEIDNLVDLIKE